MAGSAAQHGGAGSLSARGPAPAGGGPGYAAPSGSLSARVRPKNLPNPLLLKPPLGQQRPACYELPEDGRAFGTASVVNPCPVEALMTWHGHVQSPQRQTGVQDYKRLNKGAIREKICTSKAQSRFREERDLAMPAATPQRPVPVKIPSHDNPGFVYGLQVRPSTPVKDLVNAGSSDYEQVATVQQQLNSALGQFNTKSPDARLVGTEKQARKVVQVPVTTAYGKVGKAKVVGPKKVNSRMEELTEVVTNERIQRASAAELRRLRAAAEYAGAAVGPLSSPRSKRPVAAEEASRAGAAA